MIRQIGPLRAYSTRSLERTIGRYSNSIKSKVASGANASNIAENFGVRGYIHSIMDIDELLDPIAPAPYSSKTYINDPNDIDGDQLWEPFNNKSLKTGTDNQTIENYPINIICLALTKYYSRYNSIPVKNVRIRPNIKLAGRAWINTTIYSSSKYRTMMNETRRGNHYVMFNSSYIK
jgi:hypothetical protein